MVKWEEGWEKPVSRWREELGINPVTTGPQSWHSTPGNDPPGIAQNSENRMKHSAELLLELLVVNGTLFTGR
jgi:hypothetical protein